MEVTTAACLLNDLIFRPGWTITATDHTNRFEGTVKVRIDYPAFNTDRECAPGYTEEIETHAEFAIPVSDINDDCALYRRLLDCVAEIDSHEAREALRTKGTHWAPFHPHRIDGMKRWGEPQRDLQFGLA